MEKMLKPKEGLIVRDPKTMTPLSADGEMKTFIGWEGRYWRRRVNCGDCEIVEASPVKNIRRKDEEK